jgi:hypothetical protein
MSSSSSPQENNRIEEASKRAVEALYGKDIKNFKVRVVFPYKLSNLPEDQKRAYDDVQVTFLSNNLQYTVDLVIRENGQITNARLIDTMTPL